MYLSVESNLNVWAKSLLNYFYHFDYVLGTNNLMVYNEEDTVHGIKEVMNYILAKITNTKILLLSIIPRLDDLEKKVQATNDILSEFNDDKHVFY